MKFEEWVASRGGASAVARELGVTPVAVHYWMKGESCPAPERMEQIVSISGGRVSYAEIIGLKKKAKNRGRA